jgi:hypothetical protein
MKVAAVSYSYIDGGAARAALASLRRRSIYGQEGNTDDE